MKNCIRRCIAFIMSLSMTLLFLLPISSVNALAPPDDEVVINEFAVLLEEKKIIDSKKTNTKSQQLNEIDLKIKEFKDHIYSLKDYDQDELKHYGYNDAQITAIKSYDGSDEKTLLASATITASVSNSPITYSYNASSNSTTFKQTVTFTVNGVLGWYFTNYAGVTFTAGNGNPFRPITSSNVSGNVRYKTYNNGQAGPEVTRSFTKLGDDGVNGAYKVSFPSRDPSTYGNIYKVTLTAKSSVEGNPTYIIYRYAYGYVSISWSGSAGLSFSGTPSIGISISPKANTTLYPSSGANKTYNRP